MSFINSGMSRREGVGSKLNVEIKSFSKHIISDLIPFLFLLMLHCFLL